MVYFPLYSDSSLFQGRLMLRPIRGFLQPGNLKQLLLVKMCVRKKVQAASCVSKFRKRISPKTDRLLSKRILGQTKVGRSVGPSFCLHLSFTKSLFSPPPSPSSPFTSAITLPSLSGYTRQKERRHTVTQIGLRPCLGSARARSVTRGRNFQLEENMYSYW